jgi:outer membrane lipoprotein-sorting protein
MKIFFALAALILFFAVGAAAETTNTLSDAEIQGRKLAQQILAQSPVANFTQTGILKIRSKTGTTTDVPVSFKTLISTEIWQTSYTGGEDLLVVVHQNGHANRYAFHRESAEEQKSKEIMSSFVTLRGGQITSPFADSDFWICDLGLEFFHWPAQKILPKTTNLMRGRDYTLLESTNPNPPANGYSRVLTWMDKETGGPLQAEAYDFNGKLLKEFAPKSFKKVNGQWQLQEMEIRNVQTGSRTRLEFDLNKQ